MMGNSNQMGSKNHTFKPHLESNQKSGKKFYYQHICVGDNNFVAKSAEELRFEDQFNTVAAPGTDQPVDNNGNLQSNTNTSAWGSNTNSTGNTNAWGSTTNNNNGSTSTFGSGWGSNNNTNSNNTGSSLWGNTSTGNNNNSSSGITGFGANPNASNSANVQSQTANGNNTNNTNTNNANTTGFSWGNNNNSSSTTNNNANSGSSWNFGSSSTNNNTNNGSGSGSGSLWGTSSTNNTNNGSTNLWGNTSNNSTGNNNNNNNSTWSFGSSNNNSTGNNNSGSSGTSLWGSNNTSTGNNNNNNSGGNNTWSWGQNNSNAANQFGSSTNNNNSNSTNTGNSGSGGFSWGNTSTSNNNSNSSGNNNSSSGGFNWGNTGTSGTSNNNSSGNNNSSSGFNWGGTSTSNNNNNNNSSGNNNNSSGGFNWNSGSNNNSNSTNTNNNNGNSGGSTWNFGSTSTNNTNNNNSNGNNNNSSSGGGMSWNFGSNSNNNSNGNNNNSGSSFNWGSSSNNNNNGNNGNNNNFGTSSGNNGNSNNNGIVGSFNNNPYQMDINQEFREITDPNSALNQSFSGKGKYWKSDFLTPGKSSATKSMFQATSRKSLNKSIIKLHTTPRSASMMMPQSKKSQIINLKPTAGPLVVAQQNRSIMGESTLNNRNTPRFGQSSILSRIVQSNSMMNPMTDPMDRGGNGQSQYTPSRSMYSSDLRRITNLGDLPPKPDLSAYYINRDDDQTAGTAHSDDDSDHSGDSPDEDPLHRRSDRGRLDGHHGAQRRNSELIQEEEEEEELPPIGTSSTHRKDGVIYPKLTRSEYYTKPSMESLKRMTERELFEVADFTVGHDDYGSVQWKGLTDVRALDLDAIVEFEHGKIEVYDDTLSDKPQHGEYLNKYAIIRLQSIWSQQVEKAKEEGTTLSDAQREKYQTEWGKILQDHCANTGTKFNAYDEVKGEWAFEVEHFTIYGMPGAKPKATGKASSVTMKMTTKKEVLHDPFAPMTTTNVGPSMTANHMDNVDPIGAVFAMNPDVPEQNADHKDEDTLDTRSVHSYKSANVSMGRSGIYSVPQYADKMGLSDIMTSFRGHIDTDPSIPHNGVHSIPTQSHRVPPHPIPIVDDGFLYDDRATEMMVEEEKPFECPPDAIIFDESVLQNVVNQNDSAMVDAQSMKQNECFPGTQILKKPDPFTCSKEISTAFAAALKAELDAIKPKKEELDSSYLPEEVRRAQSEERVQGFSARSAWNLHDLGWRNRGMFSAVMKRGHLYSVQSRQYFESSKISNFHKLSECNIVERHSIISGLDKILGKSVYLDLVHGLLSVHKRLHFDQANSWNNKSNGDQLQDLCDSYCHQIRNVMTYQGIECRGDAVHQKKQSLMNIMGKKVLIKMYDAFQLLLALHAPRCQPGEQSNLRIKEDKYLMVQKAVAFAFKDKRVGLVARQVMEGMKLRSTSSIVEDLDSVDDSQIIQKMRSQFERQLQMEWDIPSQNTLFEILCDIFIHNVTDLDNLSFLEHDMNLDDDDDDDGESDSFGVDIDGDDDQKSGDPQRRRNRKKQIKPSYAEMFALRVNISRWLENVIRDEVNAEIKAFDAEIENIKNGGFTEKERDDEKHNEMEQSAVRYDGMVDAVEQKEEINRLNEEKIFILLTANRKQEAAKLALQCRDYRLATLISQSGHFLAAKDRYQPFADLRDQIKHWQKMKVYDTFSPIRRAIYALIAGRYCEVVSARNFSWFRCFGILLWWFLPIHYDLAQCINTFNKNVEHNKAEYGFPRPILTLSADIGAIDEQHKRQRSDLMNNKPKATLSASMFTDDELKDEFPNDLCFDLLRAKCGMLDDEFTIFNPRNAGPFRLEYVVQWILHDLLVETGHIAVRRESSNICHSFIEQLERMGYWQWAIYVALFAAKNESHFGATYDYKQIAYLVLQRNINRPIPNGSHSGRHYEEDGDGDVDVMVQRMERKRLFKYCTKSDLFYNKILVKKKWIERLDASTIDALTFLVHIQVPEHWIIYCLAEYAESCSLWTVAFVSYKDCATWHKVHDILMTHLFMDWMFEDRIEEMLMKTLTTLEMNRRYIGEWRRNGMVLLEYIRLMKDIQSARRLKEIGLSRVDAVRKGIDEMLDELNGSGIESDVYVRDEAELEAQEMKKRVCLMTMMQRLDTCAVHLSLQKR